MEFVECLGGQEGEKDNRPDIDRINPVCHERVQPSCSKCSEQEEHVVPSGIWMVGTELGM